LIRAGGISFKDYPLEEAIERMRRAGYDGWEVFTPQIAKVKTPELLEQFVEYTKRAGLEVCALNDNDNDQFRPFDTESGFERTLQLMKEGVRLANALHVRDVMYWEGVRPRGTTGATRSSSRSRPGSTRRRYPTLRDSGSGSSRSRTLSPWG
jgi:sugar phosphate isomerase/epimerase